MGIVEAVIGGLLLALALYLIGVLRAWWQRHKAPVEAVKPAHEEPDPDARIKPRMQADVDPLAGRIVDGPAGTSIVSDQQPRTFPQVAIRIHRFSWTDEEQNTRIDFPVTFTNQNDDPISAQFRLGLKRPIGLVVWLKRYPGLASVFHGDRLPPIGIGAKTTETFDLRFWVSNRHVEEIRDDPREIAGKTHWRLPPEAFVLEVEDYVSGAVTEMPLAIGRGAMAASG